MNISVKDLDAKARYALAENQNNSVELLTVLTCDNNPTIALKAEQTLAHVLSCKQETTLLKINSKDTEKLIRFRHGRPSYEGLCGYLWRYDLVKRRELGRWH